MQPIVLKSFFNLKNISIISLVLWLGSFLITLLKNGPSPTEGNILAKVELLMQIVTIAILIHSYKNYKNTLTKDNKNIFLFFILLNIWLIFVDIFFYVAAYLADTYLVGLSILNFIFFSVPCMLYAIFTIVFLVNILIKKIMVNRAKPPIKIFILLLVSIVIFAFYLSSLQYAYQILSLKNLLQIGLLFSEFILFDICIIGMIYAAHSAAFILLIGIIALVTGDFFLTYTYISQKIAKYFIIGEFFWCLGLLILFLTAVFINNYKSLNISTWFKNDNAITSRIGFHIYLVSIISYLIIFSICYQFKLLDNNFFVIFPILTMLYSIMVVVFSISIGKLLEEPFKKLEHNIQVTLFQKSKNNRDNNDKSHNVIYTFELEEFNYLQNFLTEAVKLKEYNNQLHIKFGDISAQAAHDLGSPLSNLAISMQNFKNNNHLTSDDLYEIDLIEMSTVRIKEITDNLLEEYRKIPTLNTSNHLINCNYNYDDGEKPRYIDLTKLIEEIIFCKKREWQANPCNIKFQIETNNQYFYLAPSIMRRIISNLLNNSYESFHTNIRNIYIIISQTLNKLLIQLKDTGCGIDPKNKQSIFKGKSSKHAGKGLGVSYAYEYLKSIDGNMVYEPNQPIGTIMTLHLPLVPEPQWIVNTLTCPTNNSVVILDDDSSIHKIYRNKLMSKRISSYHFLEITEFFNFISQQNSLSNFIFLIDFNLHHDEWDGFKVIDYLLNKFIHKSAIYLQTNDAEKFSIQSYVNNNYVQLIPKNILSTLTILST